GEEEARRIHLATLHLACLCSIPTAYTFCFVSPFSSEIHCLVSRFHHGEAASICADIIFSAL
ncbi:hypothetical protein, partial [Salmonella sp. NW1149]|uniref:hypothetical protein n=1 Tax=Salmonella sp. NW1149 TaxID=2947583 RepID=UPI003F48155F